MVLFAIYILTYLEGTRQECDDVVASTTISFNHSTKYNNTIQQWQQILHCLSSSSEWFSIAIALAEMSVISRDIELDHQV